MAVSYDTVRKGVHIACKKAGIEQAGRGCHGFRHSYARDRFAQLASAEQKNMMDRILDNRSIGRKADYGMVSEHDKELYESTRAVMNTDALQHEYVKKIGTVGYSQYLFSSFFKPIIKWFLPFIIYL